MMRTLTALSLLCAGAAGLLACSPYQVLPPAAVTAQATDTYIAGRNHHLARRYGEARAAYQSALAAQPDHVDARNGLATLHAEQRDFPAAIGIWRELTASLTMSAGAGKAYLFSNLGQAYFLSGDYDNAVVALEKACLLDPLGHRSWQLLGDTLRKLGQEERAEQMLKQAAALRQHDLRADFARTGARTSVAAIGQALQAQELPESAWAEARLVAGADGMLTLHRGMPPAAAALPAATHTVRLEIRNGNGVTGMARALSRRIVPPGLKVTRLSNEQGFGVRRTRIEYEAGHLDAARKLARRVGSAQLREVQECAPADLRLVLGRDMAGSRSAWRRAAQGQGGSRPALAARAMQPDKAG